MYLKSIKPITPSQRQLKLLDKSTLSKKIKPLKSLTSGLSLSGGRNNLGRITNYRIGGGHKRLYRKINFYRKEKESIVLSIEYDPNRTANIASIYDTINRSPSYILAPQGLKKGDLVCSWHTAQIKIGHTLSLEKVPVGTFIHNVSVSPKKKGQIARAAGNYIQLLGKQQGLCRLKFPSGKQKVVLEACRASIGTLSNENKNLINLGKAGRSTWLNKRPSVRGVAMNPHDHPHGGGEGKTSGGRPSVTPWGKPARGQKTAKFR
jgi:large subunit ribosomal protein L2